MADDNTIERVGLGVDLLGGPELLLQLRAVRAEMQAIADLGGRGARATSATTGGFGTSAIGGKSVRETLSTEEKAHDQYIETVKRKRIQGSTAISQAEVRAEADTLLRKRALTKAANDLIISDARAHEAKVAQIEQVAEDSRVKRRADAQKRITNYAQKYDPIYDPNEYKQQARSFQKARNDPARGEQTNMYRTEIAEMRLGQRQYEREARAIAREKNKLDDELRQRATRNRQQYFAKDFQIQNPVLPPDLGPTRRTYESIEKSRRNVERYIAQGQGHIFNDPKLAKTREGEIYRQITGAQDPNYGLTAQQRAVAARKAQLEEEVEKARERQQTRDYVKTQRENEIIRAERRFAPPPPPVLTPAQLKQQTFRRYLAGTGPSPNNPPNNPPNLPPNFRGGGDSGALNPRGFFTSVDVVGRIARNILLYEAVSKLSYGTVQFAADSVKAAKTSVEFGNALRFATESAQGNVAANLELADSLRPIGLSRQQGRAAVTEAARFAEDRPEDTERLTRIVTNIAAERGGGVDRTDELIEQLRRRESKFFKRIFGSTVEQIYIDAASQAVNANTTSISDTPGLYKGLKNDEFKSKSRLIKEYVTDMDEAAKAQAVFNYILSQEGKFAGEAAERANTLAGRLDKVSAAFLDGQEGLGLFITDLRVFSNIADSLSGKAGFLDSLRGPTLGRTGPRGTISESDIQLYADETIHSKRSRLLASTNSVLDTATSTPALAAVGGAIAFSVLGSRKALVAQQEKAYQATLAQVGDKFKGDLGAATQEALANAKNARAGYFNKITTGIGRVTNGVTSNVLGGLESTARFFDLNGPANLLANRSARFGGPQIGPNISPFIRPEYLAADQAARARGSAIGSGAGGIAGGFIGAEIGSFVADKITSNTIVATGITILGGIAGTAAGSAIGDAIGGAAGGAIAGAGGIGKFLQGPAKGAGAAGVGIAGLTLGYGIGSIIEPFISDALDGPTGRNRRLLLLEQRSKAESVAKKLQSKEFERNQEQDLIRYRFGPGGPLGLQTYDQAIPFINQGVPYTKEAITKKQQADSVRTESGIRSGIASIRDIFGLTGDKERGLSGDLYKTRTYQLGVGGPDFSSTTFDAGDVQKQLNNKRQGLEEEIKYLDQQRTIYKDNKEISDSITQTIEERTNYLNTVTEAQKRLNGLVEDEENIRKYGTTDAKQIAITEDYRVRQQKNIENRKEKDLREIQQARDEYTSQASPALGKLRDFTQGSFKLLGDIASARTGEDNPYVKVLSDQQSAAQRMQLQWGFLDDAAVKYFTTLEQAALNRQLTKLEFSTYTTASNLNLQAGREATERTAPGLSRREQEYLDIQSAIVDKAVEIPKLWAKAAEVVGKQINPIQQLQGRIAALQLATGLGASYDPSVPLNLTPAPEAGQRYRYSPDNRLIGGDKIAGFNTGAKTSTLILPDGSQVTTILDSGRTDDYAKYAIQQKEVLRQSPEVQQRIKEQYADSALSILDEFTPQQIRRAGLQNVYAGAINVKAQGLDQRIAEAQQKAQYGAIEDKRLADQLKSDEEFRRNEISKGRDSTEIGKSSDALLLARTDNIPVKDLTFDQYKSRQEALRRTAERTVKEQDDAKLALKEATDAQVNLTKAVESLRQEILAGNLSVLIQVQNDTQARSDQEGLQDIATGKNPAIDQRNTKSSAYTDAFKRYNNRK